MYKVWVKQLFDNEVVFEGELETIEEIYAKFHQLSDNSVYVLDVEFELIPSWESLTLRTLIQEWQVWSLGHKELRFGQYICNVLLDGGESWPELFYEEDEDKAFAILVERIME